MREIRLLGELGKKFGELFRLQVATPAEAIRALASQLNGFEKFVLDSEQNGVGYVVRVGDEEIIDKKELFLYGAAPIFIVPVVAGSNGEARVLLGATLIVASFFTGPASPYLMNAGIAMALGGAAEILTRGMMPTNNPYEKDANKPSYSFNGPINTNAQGHPVPLCYGIMRVGGAVISASIQTENLLAGYVYEDQEDFVEAVAWNTDTNYAGPIPSNITRRELLAFTPKDPYDSNSIDRWLWKIYFMKKVLVLREL